MNLSLIYSLKFSFFDSDGSMQWRLWFSHIQASGIDREWQK